jgi:hypothetical protein
MLTGFSHGIGSIGFSLNTLDFEGEESVRSNNRFFDV